MTDSKPVEVQVDAATDSKVPEPKTGKPNSVTTTVFVPSGPVAKSEIIRTAIASVRDAIPIVYELEANITDAKKVTRDKQAGTEFTVTVDYTPRGVGKEAPIDPKKISEGLQAPRFPGVHEGDPDFGSEGEPV